MIIECSDIPNELHAYFSSDMDSIKSTLTSNPFSHILCYYDKKYVVGYLLYSQMYERMEVEYIKVEETFQNQHIASSLLERLINIAIKNNVKNITLEVRESNAIAIHVYEKYGFCKEAIRQNYYASENGILMMKKIED